KDARDPHPRLRDFLEHQRIRDGVDGDAVELFGYEHAEQAHPLHLVDDLFRIAAGELPLASDRRDALPREFANQVAERALVVGQLEVHVATASWLRQRVRGRGGRQAPYGETL